MDSIFLPQAGIVENLLDASIAALSELPEGASKNMLMEAMEPFKSAITPSAIFLEEVYEYANNESISISPEEATSILETAANDIDTNYVSDAVIYHIDEFISGTANAG